MVSDDKKTQEKFVGGSNMYAILYDIVDDEVTLRIVRMKNDVDPNTYRLEPDIEGVDFKYYDPVAIEPTIEEEIALISLGPNKADTSIGVYSDYDLLLRKELTVTWEERKDN